MKATQALRELGQSVWLDNITRDLLAGGTLKRYIDELSVSGLTSNPTIFDHALKNTSAYDAAIRARVREGKSGGALFFDLEEGARAFVNSWNELLARIAAKSAELKKAG
jgi:transaldolase